MNRIKWIDAAKGIAIVWIVLGHVLKFGDVHNIVYSFHVPLFFFLSGATAKEGFSAHRIGSDAKRLLIPYYFFGAVSIAVYAVFGNHVSAVLADGESFSIWENTGRLLYGSSILPFNAPLYFLPCLFITKLWHYLVCHVHRSRAVQVCWSVLGAALGFLFTKLSPVSLPFSFELMLKLYPFFLIGRIMAEFLTHMGENADFRYRFLLLGLVLFLLAVILGIAAPSVNYTDNNIPMPLLFYFTAWIGISGTYCLSVCLQNVKWLLYLGKKTISVVTMHKFPIVFFQVYGPFAAVLTNPDSLQGIVYGGASVTIIAILSCLAVGHMIELYLPVIFGKK